MYQDFTSYCKEQVVNTDVLTVSYPTIFLLVIDYTQDTSEKLRRMWTDFIPLLGDQIVSRRASICADIDVQAWVSPWYQLALVSVIVTNLR